MGATVEKFINSLGLGGDNKGLAQVLIKDERDVKDFYIGYLGNNAYIIDDLLDYRESKISILNMSFNKFSNMCDDLGIKDAFEQTFSFYFNSQSIKLVKMMIELERTSLEDIYYQFVKNPNENILKNIL